MEEQKKEITPKKPANDVLQEFMKENSIVIEVSPLIARRVEDGSLIIYQPLPTAKYGNNDVRGTNTE